MIINIKRPINKVYMRKYLFVSFYLLLCFAANAQTPTNVIKDTGNVGVGTVTPVSKLHVVGTATVTGNINLSAPQDQIGMGLSDNFTYESITQPQSGMQWTPDTALPGTALLWLSGYGGLKFFTASTPRMIVNYFGRVGIGTMNPVKQLVVSNNGAEGLEFYAGVTSGVTGLQCYNRSTNAYVNMEMYANQYALMQGNVGIGTKNPQSLLAVAGTITAKQVAVSQTGWSDFVFDSTYQRMPLGAVATYTQEHKHLPGIPSGADIEKGGLDLGAMEKLHMQKIEELTLYAIDADKRASRDEDLIAQQQALLTQLAAQLKAQQAEIDHLKTQHSAQH